MSSAVLAIIGCSCVVITLLVVLGKIIYSAGGELRGLVVEVRAAAKAAEPVPGLQKDVAVLQAESRQHDARIERLENKSPVH